MTSLNNTDFVLLVVLDGWGLAPQGPGNAVTLAKTPNIDRLSASFPYTTLAASGEAVGLPRSEPGNTETGHLNLGAGRIVYQDLARINMSIADGTFFNNQQFLSAIEHVKKNNSKLHLMGLVGAGGVHSNIEHLYALIQLAAKKGCQKLFIHAFTDGRDSPPTSSKTYIQNLRGVIKREGLGQIASIMGRYYAMDRDLRWDRTEKAYVALTKGIGHLVKTPEEAIESSYLQGKTDEFIEPSIISDNSGKPLTMVSDNDAIIFFNFRIDRPRQLTKAFVAPSFDSSKMQWDFDPYAVKYEMKHSPELKKIPPVFNRGNPINNLFFATMTEYSTQLVKDGTKVAFPPEKIDMPLGRILSESNYKQLRMAETEKERFVTYYFNGLQEAVFDGEDRIIVQSPKVPTYDRKPEMSANELTDKLLEVLQTNNQYKFILVNFANPDMVGHTGNIGPAVKACEVVDACVGKLSNHILAYNGTLLITADHGNVEEMINAKTGIIDTEHSSNPVPFIAISKNYLGKAQKLESGILADIAPTVLTLLHLKTPSVMTGKNLLQGLKI